MQAYISLVVKHLCHSMLTGLICGIYGYIKYVG